MKYYIFYFPEVTVCKKDLIWNNPFQDLKGFILSYFYFLYKFYSVIQTIFAFKFWIVYYQAKILFKMNMKLKNKYLYQCLKKDCSSTFSKFFMCVISNLIVCKLFVFGLVTGLVYMPTIVIPMHALKVPYQVLCCGVRGVDIFFPWDVYLFHDYEIFFRIGIGSSAVPIFFKLPFILWRFNQRGLISQY